MIIEQIKGLLKQEPQIAEFLQRHLNQNAKSPQEIFAAKHTKRLNVVVQLLRGNICKNIISQVFLSAPEEVCTELAQHLAMLATRQPAKFIEYLQQKSDKTNSYSLTIFEEIIRYAPLSSRQIIMRALHSVPKTQPFFTNYLKNFTVNDYIKLFDFSKQDAESKETNELLCNFLISYVGSKINQTLYPFLQTSTDEYDVFIQLFNKNPPENIGLLLLSLLKNIFKYSNETERYNLLAGKPNILHVVFRLKPIFISSLWAIITTGQDIAPSNDAQPVIAVKNILNLFKTDFDSKKPLQILLENPDSNIATDIFINPFFKKFLLRPLAEELLTTVVKTENYPVLAFILEMQANDRTVFPTAAFETMRTKILKANKETLKKYVAAYPILLSIYNSKNLSEKDCQLIKQLIAENPGIMDTVWASNNTLMHLAARFNVINMVKILLECKWDTQVKNHNNLTPLGEAAVNGNIATVQLLLPSADTENLNNSLSALQNNTKSNFRWENFYQGSSTDNFHTLVHKYCLQNNDAETLIYYHLTQKMPICSDNLGIIHGIIAKKIAAIYACNGANERAALSWQLTTWLHLLPQQHYQPVCDSLPLAAHKQIVVTALMNGLMKKIVYKGLSIDSFTRLKEIIHTIEKNDASLQNLATFYFGQVELDTFHPKMLTDLAHYLSPMQLLSTCNQRTGIHKLIAFTFILQAQNPPYNDSQALRSFTEELCRLKNPDHLRLLLNLAVTPHAKKVLRSIILDNGQHSLQSLLAVVCNQYQEDQPLADQSLLRELLIERCKETPHPELVTALFAVTTQTESENIITSLQKEPGMDTNAGSDLQPVKTACINNLRRLGVLPLLAKVELMYKQALQLQKNLNKNTEIFSINTQIVQQLNILYRQYLDYFLGKITQFSFPHEQLQQTISNLHVKLDESAQALPAAAQKLYLLNIDRLRQLQESEVRTLTFAATMGKGDANKKIPAVTADAIVKGLLRNSDSKQLNLVFTHSLAAKDVLDLKEFFKSLHLYCQKYSEKIDEKCLGEVDQILKYFTDLGTPGGLKNELFLNLCINNNFMLSDFLNIIYQEDEANLRKFKTLCEIAGNHSFTEIIDYAVKCKEHSFSQKSLINGLLNAGINPETINLAKPLQNLNVQLQTLQTHSSSIKFLVQHHQSKQHALHERLHSLHQITDNGSLLHPQPVIDVINDWQKTFSTTTEEMKKKIFLHVAELLTEVSLDKVTEITAELSPQFIQELTEQAILSLHSTMPVEKNSAQFFFTTICQDHRPFNQKNLDLIKHRLGQKDLTLLGEGQLQDLATDILKNNDDSSLEKTFNGIWIQRLLSTPGFIAHCTPQVLGALIERYRLLSLSLKQDEFKQLMAWFNNPHGYFNHYDESISRVERELAGNPATRNHIAKKMQSLLSFRADDAVRALLTQLENECLNSADLENHVKQKALDNLYNYYHIHLKNFRSGFIYRVCNGLHERLVGSAGDVALTQNTLMRWLHLYIPHDNFEQGELVNKDERTIYSENGDKIGFINELNQAMTIIDNQPVTLLSLNKPENQLYPVGMVLYNAQQRQIGILTAKGKLERTNLYQKHTSAMLFARIPQSELQSGEPAALKLLLQDIVNENSVQIVYEQSDAHKKNWFTQYLQGHLHEVDTPYKAKLLQSFMAQLSVHENISLLGTCKNFNNARVIFNNLIKDNAQNTQFWSPENQPLITAFLCKHNHEDQAPQLFADALLSAQNPQQTEHILAAFSSFTGAYFHDFLAQTLGLMAKENRLSTDKRQQLAQYLTSNNETAKHIWQNYFHASSQTTIQQIDENLSRNFSQLFDKRQFHELIRSLKNCSNWQDDYRYRLAVLILSQQKDNFFPDNEFTHSRQKGWNASMLADYSWFIKQHLHTQENFDSNKEIARTIIEQLSLRTANFGCTQLFYNDQQFDDEMVAFAIARENVGTLIANVISFTTRLSEVIISSLKSWLNNNNDNLSQPTELQTTELAFLRNNKAVIEWKKVINSTWGFQDKDEKSLPLITAFLLNYSGSSDKAQMLIRDYLQSVQKQKEDKYYLLLSSLLLRASTRSICPVIFNTLEDFYTENPSQLSLKAFRHLAKFFSGSDIEPNKAYFALLEHFGKQKKYSLVIQCCALLNNFYTAPELEKQRLHIANITRLSKRESTISTYLGSLWFFIIKFFYRTLPDFFNEKPCDFILNCDDVSTYHHPVIAPKMVVTELRDGNEVNADLEFYEKYKRVEQRLQSTLAKAVHGKFEQSIASIPDPAINVLKAPLQETAPEEVTEDLLHEEDTDTSNDSQLDNPLIYTGQCGSLFFKDDTRNITKNVQEKSTLIAVKS